MRQYQRPRQIQNTQENHGLMMTAKRPTKIAQRPNNIFRAKARRTVKQNRLTFWRNFVSKLNCHTPMNKVWNMIPKINGKNNKTNVHH
jgi:hypothetical protein